jgi:ectoine hydroxylase-related dioxygenase (phytanoyl-CoA dioxygenase family)
MAETQVMERRATVTLTPEQVAFFQENGFLALPAITTAEEVAMMRAAYDRIFAERAGREEGNQFDLAGADEEDDEPDLPQILNPSKYAPELRDTLARANALAIARQLLGDDIEYMGDHAILKPARHGAATPWHQDEAYWNPAIEYRALSVWLPLQDVNEENGCMQFIPGTHKTDILPHQPINNDPRIHGLEVTAEVDISQPAICPLPAGGATFHPSRTLHYTAPNNSDAPRRALIMMFGTPKKQTREELGLPPRSFPWQAIQRTARAERARAAKEREGSMGMG